jgi:protein TonB
VRRLLMAFGAAVAIHGLLLVTKPGWLEIPPPPQMQSRPVTLTLGVYQKERPWENPVEKIPETVKKTVIAVPKKQKAEPPPTPNPPKKEMVRHRKTIPEPPKKIPRPQKRTPEPHPPKKTLASAEEVPAPKAASRPDASLETKPPIEQERPRAPIESFATTPYFKEGLLEKAGTRENQQTISGPKVPGVRKGTPAYKRTPPPPYPRLARKRGYEGTVILEVLVDREGNVGDLRLFRSSGYGILDKAAMKSVREWVFEPGTVEEEKVEMWVRIPVRFQLR